MNINELKKRAGVAITESVADKIQFTAQVNISDMTLTADDWELYDLPNREPVAMALNGQFRVSVNRGSSRTEVVQDMSKIMTEFADFGASDIEPRWVLRQLIDSVGLSD